MINEIEKPEREVPIVKMSEKKTFITLPLRHYKAGSETVSITKSVSNQKDQINGVAYVSPFIGVFIGFTLGFIINPLYGGVIGFITGAILVVTTGLLVDNHRKKIKGLIFS